ncbi:hypothetical protein J2Z66_004168 [Paenibacillus eucommiae]|uniref:Excalibur calcium-binding domain-containing protein n=1 Tax=Paenibacillus eucommiae TaxID=1355755 RepID=A0ABS4IY90_9BACL|nr:hypothetical protein [Paenibacillus eucommiae]
MKKVLITLTIFILAMSVGVGAYAATKLTLVVNGEKITNADPKLIDGVTYVPLRAVAEMLDASVGWDGNTSTVTVTGKDFKASSTTYDATLEFPVDKYPETAAHIQAAIAKGQSAICSIDRGGADKNREESLKGLPTKSGFDRDEWPMAMCAEGGKGADIAYVTPADNRGAGSWVSNQLEDFPDGTRVLFVFDGSSTATTTTPVTKPSNEIGNTSDIIYNSCAEVKAAGKAPIHKGDPGFSTKLDRDGDGVACEG